MAFITEKVSFVDCAVMAMLLSVASGPKRYDYDADQKKWFYHRDNHTLDELLNEELSDVFGHPIDVLEGLEPQ